MTPRGTRRDWSSFGFQQQKGIDFTKIFSHVAKLKLLNLF